MALRRFDLDAGGDDFAFRPETEPTIAFWLGKYPEARKASAVIPLLWLAQKDNGGWLSEPAMRHVADRLAMPYIRVYEVATFYTMFRLQPVGRFHVQLCGTTPCMLRGANELKKVCERKIGKPMSVTDNGRLSWEEVECLGACVNAPMAQINDYYYEDLTPDSFADILDRLANGVEVAPGTFVDRLNSAPQGELSSLQDESLFDGSKARPLAAIPNAPKPPEPEPAPAPAPQPAPVASAPPVLPEAGQGGRPAAMAAPGGDSQDLKRISGIGPKIEATLKELGIHTYAQIAGWTPENADWIDGYLSFRGRIAREDWIGQARVLAAGGMTEFASRVARGEVDSSKASEEG